MSMGKFDPQHSIFDRIFGLQQHSEKHFFGTPCNCNHPPLEIARVVFYTHQRLTRRAAIECSCIREEREGGVHS